MVGYRIREQPTFLSNHTLLMNVSDRSLLVWGFSHHVIFSFKIKDPVQLREMYTKNRRFKVDIVCLLPLETLSSITFCEYPASLLMKCRVAETITKAGDFLSDDTCAVERDVCKQESV